MKVFLVIGACGSGKTWIMEQIVKHYKLDMPGKVGMFYYHRNYKLMCLGKYDGSTFQGSDKLSMAIMRDVPEFKKYIAKNNMVVVCEGDRFMNDTFIKAMRPNINIIAILDDGAKGRKKRKSTQTERQIKSIQTRVSKLVGSAKYQCVDSTEALRVLKEELKFVA
jgi:hypothetical protein